MSYVEVPGAKVPIRMWADPGTVEDGAMQQLRNVSTLPWIKGLAVMPDVHYGKGATVGSVIAMQGAVCPAAVGVDIGCGMSAVKTSLTANDLPGDLSRLRSKVEQAIPVGRGMHDSPVEPGRFHGLATAGWEEFWGRFDGVAEAVKFRQGRATLQMGTLGAGNHFAEVCISESGSVWLMLHSGSRNIGNALLKDVVRKEFKKARVTFEPEVSCHHNYVNRERYDGMDLLVTRKGAISARAGEYGIIPGSMGTGSYIVKGLGNEKAFNSASHGAGRRMSRSAAKRRFSTKDLEEQTQGVECRKDSGVVDEIPSAYKPIEQVIDQQRDLVEVVAKLKQVVCVKG
ncbi:RtcB family protein [Streptomyces sp. NBC_00878]|uniref:RtcB family protein n=1 Tax=Streptomyces sp. NBC_00878 TaxID=2975854 RepID=UPI00225BE777|nr:RtcB family protein [Streptomyces sp. NBC_00878]MCX4907864.1 RtcB family protein [Streptomyces sp. NBC_00878]